MAVVGLPAGGVVGEVWTRDADGLTATIRLQKGKTRVLICLVVLLQVCFVFTALFAVASAFRRRGWDVVLSLAGAMVVISITAFCGLVVSWACLPIVKVQTALAAYAGLAIAYLFGRALVERRWRDEISTPVLLDFVATIVLLVWAFAGFSVDDPLIFATSRWSHPLPDDNQLPLYVAQALHDGTIAHEPATMGDWLYSDRPPLQTALFMLTPGFMIQGPTHWSYQAAAVAFQMWVLVALWGFVRAFTPKVWVANLACAVAFFSPLVLVNGLFVWPKLLAASFLLLLVAIVTSPGGRRQIREDRIVAALSGALAALAMLSHGGAAFTLIGFVLVLVVLGPRPPRRSAVAMLVVAASVYAPWMAYQKFVDPPGNRLLKTHLAGVSDLDARSLGRALFDRYGSQSVATLWATREINFDLLFADTFDVLARTSHAASAMIRGNDETAARVLKEVRLRQFFYFSASIGLFGLSVFSIVWAGLILDALRPVCATIILSLAVWIGLMFEPNSAIVHQGSYFPQLALIAVSSLVLARMWPPAFVALAVVQVTLTAFQYGF